MRRGGGLFTRRSQAYLTAVAESPAMTTATARTVRSGDAELLPIPADMAFGEGVELRLVRSGDVLTI